MSPRRIRDPSRDAELRDAERRQTNASVAPDRPRADAEWARSRGGVGVAGHRSRKPNTVERSDDAVGRYLRQISSVPLLTHDEITALARKVEAGKIAQNRLSAIGEPDPELEANLLEIVKNGLLAKRRLVEANLRLVVSIAKNYAGYGVSLMDLIQEGNVGLIQAVERFDYRKGYRFSTYATWWIRQAILRALGEQARLVKVPPRMAEQAKGVQRTRNVLCQRLGREPTTEELAEAAGIDPERVAELEAVVHGTLSLDLPVGEGASRTLGEFLVDDSEDSPYELTIRRLAQQQVRDVMALLTDREREILALRFGLGGSRPMTLEELGKKFHVTRERVRQIEARTLAKLRHPSRARDLGEYLG